MKGRKIINSVCVIDSLKKKKCVSLNLCLFQVKEITFTGEKTLRIRLLAVDLTF